ncbi:MAG TPA: alginate export family protein [Phycisphaerae bacterium]|nr:alginate export family protein [Phycisphaerae bacterium]
MPDCKISPVWVGGCCGFWLLAAAHPLAAQDRPRTDQTDAFINQQRLIEEQTRQAFDDTVPATQRVGLDYGGWYSFHLFLSDDGLNSSRTYRRNDLRLWTRITIDRGAHEIFARARLTFLDFNTGDSFDGDDDDWEGPNLERGFYRFDLRRALSAYANRDVSYNLQFKIGRDLVTFGTGYALSTPLDHVELQAEFADLQLRGIAGRTVGSAQDFDLTRYTSRTRRAFFGLEARYLGSERHEPFAYVLWQADHNHDTFPHPLQGTDYDSFCVGVGSEGELLDNLRYSTEWVYETGRSYGHRRFAKRDVIQAWAFDTELEYLFDAPTQPRASLEYMFASGDSGRLDSPTDAIGGNRRDFTDTGFIGFGWRDTGLSFAPRLSNMHVWRCGASFFPFAAGRRVDRLEVGSDVYLYWKHHRDAAVSDFTANIQSGYLGSEIDLFANWEITTDLFWTARYGLFFPGSAFDDRTTRTFLLVGVTWSF